MTLPRLLKIILPIVFVVVAAGSIVLWGGDKEWATVRVTPDAAHLVKVADTSFEQRRGLSGSSPEELGEAVGMLFVYNDAKPRSFWMKDMRYDLDIVWLYNGKVVRLDDGVPAPKSGAEPILLNSDPLRVDMVLELPSGQAEELGFIDGADVVVDFSADNEGVR